MSWSAIRLLCAVFVVVAAGSCSSKSSTSSGPGPVSYEGKITLPAALAAVDFDVLGTADDVAAAVDDKGAFSAKAAGGRVSHLIAVPREGSAAATAMEGKTAILMTPALGGKRISADLTLSSGGSGLLNAKTTLLSILMMHPALMHHDAGVGEKQLEWLLSKAREGWPQLDAATAAYEQHLAAGTDVASDDTFAAAFGQVVSEALEQMPEIPDPSVAGSDLAAATIKPAAITIGRQRESKLSPVDGTASVYKLKPETANGTGLDYYFAVRPVEMSAFADGPDSAAFKNPNTESWPKTKGVQPIAEGVIPAASYFKVVNFADWAIELTSTALGGLVFASDGFELPKNGQIYEVRFNSGAAVSSGPFKAEYDEAFTNWFSDGTNAAVANLVSGMLESLQAIPGVGDAIGALPTATQIVAEVVKAMAVDAVNLYQAGRIPTRAELAGLMQKYAQQAGNKLVSEFSNASGGQKLKQLGVVKRFAAFMKWGARTTAKVILSVPGKVSNAGCVAHRAYRMLYPKSINEYYLVYPGGEDTKPAGCNGQASPGNDFCADHACYNCTAEGTVVSLFSCGTAGCFVSKGKTGDICDCDGF